MMALRANVLAKGYSGIRRATLDSLLDALNARVHPIVPSRGSVGASGDLAPLAHLVARADRRGTRDGRRRRGGARRRATALDARRARAGARSRPKEGLALINGTQASAAVASLALLGAERLARAADIAAALSIDGLRGSFHPFEPRLHDAAAARRAARVGRQPAAAPAEQRHQQVARELRPRAGRLLDALCAAGPRRGARRLRATSARTLGIEANAATDNPMVFADDGRHRVRRQLPRRAGGHRRGRDRARRCATGDDLASGASDRLVNPALSGLPAVPHARQRAPLGLHDGAGDRRGAGVRAQDTRASGERRHDPDVGEPRRPRQHEHGGRAQGASARSSSPRASIAIETAARVPGDRSACAARRRRRRSRRCTRACDRTCRRSTDDRPPAPDIECDRRIDRERLARTRVRRRKSSKEFLSNSN